MMHMDHIEGILPPGIILYTFLHFESTPAIVTSVVIGLGIVFCGAAVVHNVFVWQKVRKLRLHKVEGVIRMSVSPFQEKTKILKGDPRSRPVLLRGADGNKSVGGGLPQATVDLSGGGNATVISAKGLELSTLV